MPVSRKHEIGVGVLVLIALVLLGWMAVKMGSMGALSDELAVDVVFPDAAGIGVGATVRVAGVEVGRVEGLAVEGDQALIHLRLRSDSQLRQDVVAQVRARSVLGEKFIALRPQSADAPLLADGDRISHVLAQTEIDELVNALGPALQGLDTAALQRVLAQVDQALAADPERLPRMVDDVEALLHNTRLASEEGPALVGEARQAIAEVRATNRRLGPVVEHTDRLITQLSAGAEDLPATRNQVDLLLSDSRAAVADGRDMLGQMDGQMSKVDQVLGNLAEIDKWELRRLLREEGIKVRLRASPVLPDDGAP
jgi:phospholipid/cholesterol/gamma-HCH transport system substrate-binding protein